jgi:lysozyme family protein
MSHVAFTPSLAQEYRRLYAAAIRPERLAETVRLARRLAEPSRAARYRAVGDRIGVPWFVVAIIHALEAGLDFDRHLHNGDPLSGRTVRAPKGRPLTGTPPFAWEDSAADALTLAGLAAWDDWSVAGVAYVLERYNGFGYRRRSPSVPSPYLWSFTPAYVSGKYVADHVWSDTAVSRQCGGMALLRALGDAGLAELADGAAAGPEQATVSAATPQGREPAGAAGVFVTATAVQALRL